LARHPKTQFIVLHVGNNAENLPYVAECMDRFPNMHVELAARVGNSAASRAWLEGASRNIRIEFFLALMLSLMEGARLNRSSMISCIRFITAFLKPTTNISIMRLQLYLLRGGGGFTASVCLMEYSRRSTTRMPRGYCKSQGEQFSECRPVNRAITRRIGDSL
jgi:hypothetical protein